jgi:hypothetical protein
MRDKDENGLENGQPLDLVTARALSAFSNSTSRRGLIVWGGRLFLRVLGISMLPLLPLDRAFAQTAPNQNCQGDWQYCGQHGNFCQVCCGGGPYATGCPPCTNNGGWWAQCCCCPSCSGGYTIWYTDCCGLAQNTKGVTYTDAEAAACKGAYCRNGYGVGYWCSIGGKSQGTYRCTIVQQKTPCSSCKQIS